MVASAYLSGRLLGTSINKFDQPAALGSTFHLFTDDNGETLPLLVNSVSLYRDVLTESQVAELGGPTANGIEFKESAVIPAQAEGSEASD